MVLQPISPPLTPHERAEMLVKYERNAKILRRYHEEDMEKARCLLMLLTHAEWEVMKQREDHRRTLEG